MVFGGSFRKLVVAFGVIVVFAVIATHLLRAHFPAFSVAFIILFMLALAVAVAFFLSRALGGPLSEISEAARRLSRGEYDVRVRDLDDGEITQLGESLNFLAERFQMKLGELAHDKSRLSTILSNMAEAVAAIDNEGHISEINAAMAGLFGLDPEAVKGKGFLEALRHSQLNDLIRLVLKDQRDRSGEVRTFHPEERVFDARVVPLREGERPVGVLLVLHEITQIRKLELVRRDFVANVSHELRTPLASIRGYAETLRLGGLDDAENRMEFVKSIESQATRMSDLVSDLLDLAAIESGQRPVQRETLGVWEIVREVVDGLKPLTRKRSVRIELDETPVGPVEGDRLQLRQVFVNLIENAIKFNRENGLVRIRAREENRFVQVSIEDTGLGIPSGDLPRVFERFYRVDKARSREMGGTGLGLSIVRHIVEAHGGSVSVDSILGKGSVFQVVLPLHA